jgi:hypothetical protein
MDLGWDGIWIYSIQYLHLFLEFLFISPVSVEHVEAVMPIFLDYLLVD